MSGFGGDGDGSETRARKKKAKRKTLTEDELREAALSYLDRYDASRVQLERILVRKAKALETEEEARRALERIPPLLDRFEESGLVSDARFARHFVDGARRRGSSARKIAFKLAARGVASETVQAELRSSEAETGIEDRAAALVFARRKGLLRKFDLRDPKARAKALAALARQGFGYDASDAALRALQGEAAAEG